MTLSAEKRRTAGEKNVGILQNRRLLPAHGIQILILAPFLAVSAQRKDVKISVVA